MWFTTDYAWLAWNDVKYFILFALRHITQNFSFIFCVGICCRLMCLLKNYMRSFIDNVEAYKKFPCFYQKLKKTTLAEYSRLIKLTNNHFILYAMVTKLICP